MKIDGIEHVQEALEAFRQWAKMVRRSPVFSVMQEPVLVFFDDGSGYVQSVRGETRYFSFADINDLLERLKAGQP